VYRAVPTDWSQHQLDELSFFADHATSALRTTELIDRQERQLAALSRVVENLREQAHEHANRIHSVSGLLALGERKEARRFLAELLTDYQQFLRAVLVPIEDSTLAGLLVAETISANQRGISLKIDRRSRLRKLPARLTEADVITIVGQLLEHAMNGVSEMPPKRRRVTFAASSTADGGAVFRVRAWGASLTLGHAVLSDALAAVGGFISVEAVDQGSVTTATIPGDRRQGSASVTR
jgi:sensor histidine kinase regulating citrate/malate metabolism